MAANGLAVIGKLPWLLFWLLILAGLIRQFLTTESKAPTTTPVACTAPAACWQQQQAIAAQPACQSALEQKLIAANLAAQWQHEWLGAFNSFTLQDDGTLHLRGDRLTAINANGLAVNYRYQCWWNTHASTVSKTTFTHQPSKPL